MKSVFISVRGRLIGLVILSLMPALVLIIYNGLEQRNLAIKLAGDNAHEYATQISRDQSLIFQKAEQLLNALAIIPSLRQFQKTECNTLLSKLIIEYQNYLSFTVFDRNGDLRCSGPEPTRMFNIADRTHFKNAVESKSTAIGDYVISRLIGRPSIFVAYPIVDDAGVVIGTVNAGLDLRWLDLLVQNNQFKFDAEMTLFDKTGAIFASYSGNGNSTLKLGGRLPDFDSIKKVIDLDSYEFSALEGNGQGTLRVIGPLSDHNSNVYLSISMPMDRVLAEANSIFKRNILLLGIVGLLAMAAAWFMGDLFILRFVDSLVSTTRKLRDGDLSIRTRLPAGNSEFHELAHDFDSMAVALQQRNEEQMRVELALRKLATGTRREDHYLYIRTLLQDLAQTLGMEMGFVGIFDDNQSTVNTIVAYSDGKFKDNFSYALAGTPCQNVLENAICVIPDDAYLIYPDDQEIVEKGYRSYVGAILRDADNEEIGLMVFLSGSILAHEAMATSLVPVFAARIGIEMDQVRIENEREMARRSQEILTAELELKNSELERFVYTVSHEMKSPLVTIKGFVGLLTKDIGLNDVDRINTDLERISGATDTMGDLLDGLLNLSQIGRVINPPQAGSLLELIEEAVTATQDKIKEHKVVIQIDDNMPDYWGDRLRLLEVFQNLIENAVKFMGSQTMPRIEISAALKNDEVICSVKDNGIGIAPEYSDRIFNLFERLNPEIEGTGIGMALVKRIIEAHGGSIRVESEGKQLGCKFIFILPVKTAESEVLNSELT